ncbi:hypothetical protein [Thermococcus sp.]|uniref:tetratricopeptide repeat protein n=1 Tax=Thermococcus sp. TaxID=35749 RepID=UPI00261504B2|nr:hypothetical protein [Thermococcus sp.]
MDIVTFLAKERCIDEALNVAKSISDLDFQSRLQASIPISLANEGHLNEALSIARRLENPESRHMALKTIASLLIRDERLEESLKVLDDALSVEIEFGDSFLMIYDLKLENIAISLASLGLFNEALNIARKIEYLPTRARTLNRIANYIAKHGYLENALKVLDEALADAKNIRTDSEKKPLRSEALEDIAISLSRLGYPQKARNTLKEFWLPWFKFSVLKEIGIALAGMGDSEEALKTFDEALTSALEIEEDYLYDNSQELSELVCSLVDVGYLNKAQEILEKIKAPLYRCAALGRIAMYLVNSGHHSEGLLTFDKALKIANRIDDQYDRYEALIRISSYLAEAGYLDRALMISDIVLEGAEKLEYSSRQLKEIGIVLTEIASSLLESGETEKAFEVFKKSLTVVKKTENLLDYTEILKTE